MTSTRRFAAMAASGAVAMLVGGALASPALADTGDHDPNSHAAVTATELPGSRSMPLSTSGKVCSGWMERVMAPTNRAAASASSPSDPER